MLIVTIVAAVFAGSAPALGGTDAFLGETMIAAFGFCPTGWAPMNGQTLSISQGLALFDLLGTTYGGNGVTTFALPTAKPIFTATGVTLTQCIALQGNFPQRP
jgi:microcystin-dependent protein